MIKINLCPIDELESQYWFVPDVVMALVVAAAGFFGVQYYLGTLQDQVDEISAKTASLQDSTQKLAPDLERFKNLDSDVQKLNVKLTALKSITVSKIAKYKPVIILEHLQNLKPQGVWYSEIKIGFGTTDGKGTADGGEGGGDAEDTFELKGQAFDNILTAELMAAIRSTASQEYDEADLRTQVYFADDGSFKLVDTQVRPAPAAFPELKRFPEFAMHGRFAERTGPASPQGETSAPAKAPAAKKPKVPGAVSENEGPIGGPVNF